MTGTFNYFSPMSSQSGIVRSLTANPRVTNVRGEIEPPKNIDELSSTELAGVTDLINPFCVTHSDFQRIGMTVTQQRHVTPSNIANKPLIGSGMQKVIPYMIGDDFAYKAKKKGKVSKIDDINKLIILEYNDGTKGIIDLKSKLAKNVKAGFYIESKFNHDLKEGKSFNKGDILAYDNSFFQPSNEMNGGKNSIELANGRLMKSAITTDSQTFEDSAMVTERLSKDLAFNVVLDKYIALGPNANISKIVKIGDEIKASDPIIVFENSFDEAEVAQILNKLGTEHGEEILEMGRNSVIAKTSGKITDIRIFYNRPIKEFGKSLQKLIKDYIKLNEKRANIVNDTKTDDIVNINRTDMTRYQKINGQEFDGVLIQFFLSHKDYCESGDKISAQVALKSVISTVIPQDKAPQSSHTDGDINMVFSPLSVISRMTVDEYLNLYCNKVLVELKRKCQNIWNS